MSTPGEVIKALLDRPIAFHPALARAVGSVNAGVLLSQMVYWSKRTDDAEGWFWKELAEWREETCLTERELRSARRQVEASGVVASRYDRSRHRLSWRVDLDRLVDLLGGGEHLTKRQVPSDETSGATCQNVNSIYRTETTAETTAETTRGAAVKPSSSQELPARARCSCSGKRQATGHRPQATGTADPAPLAPVACSLQPVASSPSEGGVPEATSPSGEASRAPGRPETDPEPPPPKGGRPAHGAPAYRPCERTAAALALAPLQPAPLSAVIGQILAGHRQLVRAADAAGVPLGLVAQAVLERRDEALVLSWLLCARAKRGRLRSTAAFFRAGVRGAAEPRLCDHVVAKRLLVGHGLPEDPRARQLVRAIGAVLRDAQGRRPADAWREAAQARAALQRAQAREELLRRLPELHGDRRRRAEQFLASA